MRTVTNGRPLYWKSKVANRFKELSRSDIGHERRKVQMKELEQLLFGLAVNRAMEERHPDLTKNAQEIIENMISIHMSSEVERMLDAYNGTKRMQPTFWSLHPHSRSRVGQVLSTYELPEVIISQARHKLQRKLSSIDFDSCPTGTRLLERNGQFKLTCGEMFMYLRSRNLFSLNNVYVVFHAFEAPGNFPVVICGNTKLIQPREKVEKKVIITISTKML